VPDGPGDGEHINTQGGPLSLTKSHGKAIQGEIAILELGFWLLFDYISPRQYS